MRRAPSEILRDARSRVDAGGERPWRAPRARDTGSTAAWVAASATPSRGTWRQRTRVVASVVVVLVALAAVVAFLTVGLLLSDDDPGAAEVAVGQPTGDSPEGAAPPATSTPAPLPPAVTPGEGAGAASPAAGAPTGAPAAQSAASPGPASDATSDPKPAPPAGAPGAEGAAPEAAPAPSLTDWPITLTWVVGAGDSLRAIAREFSTTAAAIAELNGLPDSAAALFIGQRLQVPRGFPPPDRGLSAGVALQVQEWNTIERYVVQPGDSLALLAARSDTTVAAIAVRNGLAHPDFIFAGDVLSIPVGLR